MFQSYHLYVDDILVLAISSTLICRNMVSFKMQLDKFWSNQDVLYNFKAPFLETDSRIYT